MWFTGPLTQIFHRGNDIAFTTRTTGKISLICDVIYFISNSQADSGSKDFFEIMEVKSKIKDKPVANKLIIRDRRDKVPFIEFRNVEFRYETHKPVLSKINFQMKFGEKLALVGESGQGKSTLVNLLLRFYEPKQGAIFINKQNIADISQASLRSSVAVVSRNHFFSQERFLENIRYGKPDATIAEVNKVAKAANAYDFIMICRINLKV